MPTIRPVVVVRALEGHMELWTAPCSSSCPVEQSYDWYVVLRPCCFICTFFYFSSPVSQEQLPTALVHAGVVEQKDDNMSDGL